MSKDTMQVNLPFDAARQKRLRRFVGAMDYPSVRAFITEAVDYYIQYKLNNLEQHDRERMEDMIER